jgi:hypothetical protein
MSHSRPPLPLAAVASKSASLVETMPSPVTHGSQSTELLVAKKKMAEVQELLDQKKAEFRSRMEKCKESEEALARKQEQVKEQIAKFTRFTKENDAKRQRALKRAQDEINMRKLKVLPMVWPFSSMSRRKKRTNWKSSCALPKLTLPRRSKRLSATWSISSTSRASSSTQTNFKRSKTY